MVLVVSELLLTVLVVAVDVLQFSFRSQLLLLVAPYHITGCIHR